MKSNDVDFNRFEQSSSAFDIAAAVKRPFATGRSGSNTGTDRHGSVVQPRHNSMAIPTKSQDFSPKPSATSLGR
jgi:hypothetical protein